MIKVFKFIIPFLILGFSLPTFASFKDTSYSSSLYMKYTDTRTYLIGNKLYFSVFSRIPDSTFWDVKTIDAETIVEYDIKDRKTTKVFNNIQALGGFNIDNFNNRVISYDKKIFNLDNGELIGHINFENQIKQLLITGDYYYIYNNGNLSKYDINLNKVIETIQLDLDSSLYLYRGEIPLYVIGENIVYYDSLKKIILLDSNFEKIKELDNNYEIKTFYVENDILILFDGINKIELINSDLESINNYYLDNIEYYLLNHSDGIPHVKILDDYLFFIGSNGMNYSLIQINLLTKDLEINLLPTTIEKPILINFNYNEFFVTDNKNRIHLIDYNNKSISLTSDSIFLPLRINAESHRVVSLRSVNEIYLDECIIESEFMENRYNDFIFLKRFNNDIYFNKSHKGWLSLDDELHKVDCSDNSSIIIHSLESYLKPIDERFEYKDVTKYNDNLYILVGRKQHYFRDTLQILKFENDDKVLTDVFEFNNRDDDLSSLLPINLVINNEYSYILMAFGILMFDNLQFNAYNFYSFGFHLQPSILFQSSAISNNGRFIVGITFQDSLCIYDVKYRSVRKCISIKNEIFSFISALSISNNGDIVAIGTMSKGLYYYSAIDDKIYTSSINDKLIGYYTEGDYQNLVYAPIMDLKINDDLFLLTLLSGCGQVEFIKLPNTIGSVNTAEEGIGVISYLSSDVITILDDYVVDELRVYDLMGRELEVEQLSTHQYKIKNAKERVIFSRIIIGEKTYTEKYILER